MRSRTVQPDSTSAKAFHSKGKRSICKPPHTRHKSIMLVGGAHAARGSNTGSNSKLRVGFAKPSMFSHGVNMRRNASWNCNWYNSSASRVAKQHETLRRSSSSRALRYSKMSLVLSIPRLQAIGPPKHWQEGGGSGAQPQSPARAPGRRPACPEVGYFSCRGRPAWQQCVSSRLSFSRLDRLISSPSRHP